MAKGKFTGGKLFEKGKSGNPKGRPPLPLDMQAVRKLSPGMLKALIDKIVEMPLTQIIELKETGVLNMLELAVVNIWIKAIDDGDHSKLNFILDRSRVGKVSDKLDVSVAPKVTYKTTMSDDGRLLQDILEEESTELAATSAPPHPGVIAGSAEGTP